VKIPITRLALASLASLLLAGVAQGGEMDATSELVRMAKPAAVLITTEAGGTVGLTCPDGSRHQVAPAPEQAHGSGFLVTADGYVVTNGHVVAPYYEEDTDSRDALVMKAIAKACVPPGLSEERAQALAEQMRSRVGPSAAIEWKKTLAVILQNRERYVAEVKAYSPALAERPGRQGSASEGTLRESGKDVAILKIDATNLPTLGLGDSSRVQVGQPIFILGYPGVVLYHELLDKRSAVEPSVTNGRVSSLKQDSRGAPVIQTDAAASWGNSGGPAVNERGEGIGILTFISLTPDQTQPIQGFNFLVPANVVKEFLRSAGASPGAPGPFNAVWHDAVARFGRGDWAGALRQAEAANRLAPGFPDVQRLQAEAQRRLLEEPSPLPPLLVGAVVLALLTLAAGVVLICWRRRALRRPAPVVVEPVPPGPAAPAPSPVRVSGTDLVRVLAQRTDLVVVDVRTAASHLAGGVQAKGALRATPEDILQVCRDLAPAHGIVIYCDAPDEALSARAARQLMEHGFTRVAVLSGGFAAWLAAGLPLERTGHGVPASARPPQAALDLPEAGTFPALAAPVRVDMPIGVKAAGPYFNARATGLAMTSVWVQSPQPLPVGQRLRLTLFLKGESLEISGRVVSADPSGIVTEGTPQEVEVAFEAVEGDTATTLEGFLLATRSGGLTGR